MKNGCLVVALLVVGFGTPTPVDAAWNAWVQVDNLTASNTGSVALCARNGKVGAVYSYTISGNGGDYGVRYNEYTYTGNGGLTKTVDNEFVPNAVGYYGVDLAGVQFDSSGNALIGVIPFGGTNATLARVQARIGGGLYNADDASMTANFAMACSNRAFQLDASDSMHFVYASSASGSQQILHSSKAGGTWVTEVLDTPAAPVNNPKPDLAIDAAGHLHVTYNATAGDPAVQYVMHAWKDASGAHSEAVAASAIGDPFVWPQIAMSSNDQPMVAFYSALTSMSAAMFDGTQWNNTVVLNRSGFDFNWLGINQHMAFGVDRQGRPVMALAYNDYAEGGSSFYVDYMTWDGIQWNGERIGRFDGPWGCGGAAISIDENGRTFILVSMKQGQFTHAFLISNVIALPTVTLQGMVIPGSYTGDRSLVGIRVELRPQGGGAAIIKQTFLGSDGKFSIPSVSRGAYDIAIKADCWLQKVLPGVYINSDPYTLDTINLVGGDLDGSNGIDSTDLSFVLAAMDQNGDP